MAPSNLPPAEQKLNMVQEKTVDRSNKAVDFIERASKLCN
jgi:hypothetical protein